MTPALLPQTRRPPSDISSLLDARTQLYVPVSNALGLGSSFRELEELGYKTIFPQTYSNMALWHRDVSAQHVLFVLKSKTAREVASLLSS